MTATTTTPTIRIGDGRARRRRRGGIRTTQQNKRTTTTTEDDDDGDGGDGGDDDAHLRHGYVPTKGQDEWDGGQTDKPRR